METNTLLKGLGAWGSSSRLTMSITGEITRPLGVKYTYTCWAPGILQFYMGATTGYPDNPFKGTQGICRVQGMRLWEFLS